MVRKIFLWVFSFMLAASPVLADSQGSATGGTAGTQSTLAGGIYKATPPTLTDGQQVGLQTDANGQLKVTVSGGGSNACASATGSAVPSAACANGVNVGGTLRGQTGVNPTGSVYAGQTDVTSVGGTSTATGNGTTNAGTQRVTISSDSTGTVIATQGTAANLKTQASIASGGVASGAIASGAVASGAYASGSIASGAMVDLGAQADSACATDNGTCSAIALIKRTNQNVTTLNTTASGPLPGQSSDGVKIGAVQGTVASGSTADTYPVLVGGRAATAAPTAVTDGQTVRQQLTPEGITVTRPYSIKELMVRGTATSTDTSAHTIIASAGGSLKNYITAAQCGRTDAGSSALTITFNDSVSTVVILPAGGATNITFPTPLVTAAATAFQFTSGTGVTTLYCSAQGYTGL